MDDLNTYRVAARVDLGAIRRNLELLKGRLREGARLCAVIKTDGYGHGALPVARCARGVADWFAVATFEEAAQLREQGVEEPILILGFTHPGRYEDMIRLRIRPTIYTLEAARLFSQAAQALGTAAPLHIKLDTGMSRLGFLPGQESVEEIARISRLPGIVMEGVFTHFTSADEADKGRAVRQLDQFRQMLAALEREGVRFSIRHCANSAGILEGLGLEYDMARSGITTYGLYPSQEVDRRTVRLTPALELKSHVVHIKTVPAGTGISYGSEYVTPGPARIATIPVGYGDGYPRLLTNRGWVLIRGQRAPIRGRVCMDQFMADVTHIPGAALGDEVTLIGTDGGETISADDIARLCGTISYEIVCGLGRRIPRVYTGE